MTNSYENGNSIDYEFSLLTRTCTCRVHAMFDSEHVSPSNGQKGKTSFREQKVSHFADTSQK